MCVNLYAGGRKVTHRSLLDRLATSSDGHELCAACAHGWLLFRGRHHYRPFSDDKYHGYFLNFSFWIQGLFVLAPYVQAGGKKIDRLLWLTGYKVNKDNLHKGLGDLFGNLANTHGITITMGKISLSHLQLSLPFAYMYISILSLLFAYMYRIVDPTITFISILRHCSHDL